MEKWWYLSDTGKGYEDPGWTGIWQEVEEDWNEPPTTSGALQEQTATEGGPLHRDCFYAILHV